MKLSEQAMGALMMALQKSLLEQVDIVPVLEAFNFQLDEEERLIILNPPNFKIGNDYFEPETSSTTGSD
jgi:hypothetical protein